MRGLLPILRLASRLPAAGWPVGAALRARSSDLAELRALLAAAEEARAVAEAKSLADAAARMAADEARTAADEARAAAEARRSAR